MYYKGQKLLRIGKQAGKPEEVFVIDADGYLIKLSASEDGKDSFFCHEAKMKSNWRPAKIGVQGEMFNLPDKTVRGQWRKQYLQNGKE